MDLGEREHASTGTAYAADGTALVYRHVPAPPGSPRLALIHALAMSMRQWDEVVACLTGQCELLLIDCRGHGDSGKSEGPYNCELFADDLACAMDTVSWTSAIIAGCSMGGCIALAFAARHAERTVGLLAIDTTASYGAAAIPKWRERAERARQGGMAALVDFQLDRWFTDGFRAANPTAVQRCVEVFLANDTHCYAAACDMLSAVDLRSVLGAIDCPAIAMVGEEDYATPLAMAEIIADGIGGAELIVITAARHFAPVEKSEAVGDAVMRLHQRRAEMSASA